MKNTGVKGAIQNALGYDDTVKYRASMLPLVRTQDDKVKFGYPAAIISALESLALPGHVAQGGAYTPEDVTNMAFNVGMMGAPVGYATAPKGALAMGAGGDVKKAMTSKIQRDAALDEVVEYIAKVTSDNGYDKYGIRVSETPYKRGDRSRVWVDGEPTEDLLDGVSSVGFDHGDKDSIKRAVEIIGGYGKEGKYRGYSGKNVDILGAYTGSLGEDIGEIILKDPDIIKSMQRKTDGLSELLLSDEMSKILAGIEL